MQALSGEDAETPWLVPEEQPVELLFLQKVFLKLRSRFEKDEKDSASKESRAPKPMAKVPLMLFQRAMARLHFLLGQSPSDYTSFNALQYDSGQGNVGWWEFCMVWKQENLQVRLSTAERIHLTLESPDISKAGRLVSVTVLALILISALSFILSTLPSMQEQKCDTCAPVPYTVFDVIDTICVGLFTAEYALRLSTAAYMRAELPIMNEEQLINLLCTDEFVRWSTKLDRVWDFIRAPANLIDLLAILPSYVAWCVPKENGEQDGTLVVLKITRLMRVVRAFRLGRRFEAVVIIARTIRRSVRALWVLVLNLAIGVLILGAITFFFEQGSYDPVSQKFKRPSKYWTLNETTQRWDKVQEESPYYSIPHSFWWAVVTATTAGYGDIVPTTDLGKVAAGLCMVWSLCVIALPVGVIGSNFEKVWGEYDTEKRTEQKLKDDEKMMQRKILESIDPVNHSGRFRIEVFHDSAMVSEENDAFIGEAEGPFNIQPRCMEKVEAQLELTLTENRLKGNRKVTGKVFLNYMWLPREPKEPGVMIDGELRFTLERAEDLVQVDWKGEHASTRVSHADPYVLLTIFPNAPSKDGLLKPRVERFKTVRDSPQPSWNQTMIFDFHWKVDGIKAHKDRARHCSIHRPNEFGMCSTDAEEKAAFTVLPQIHRELDELRQSAPDIQTELRELRQATHLILDALGINPSRASPTPNGLQREAVMQREAAPQNAGEPNAAFQFVVPGMITEDSGEHPTGPASGRSFHPS